MARNPDHGSPSSVALTPAEQRMVSGRRKFVDGLRRWVVNPSRLVEVAAVAYLAAPELKSGISRVIANKADAGGWGEVAVGTVAATGAAVDAVKGVVFVARGAKKH